MWHQLLRNIAERSDREGTLPEPSPALLSEVWPALVGESIARISSPKALRANTLCIEARDKALVDDWKHSPRPLLNRIRRFSPWPIEKLEFRHHPTAGVLEPLGEEAIAPPSSAEQLSPSALSADEEQGIDAELRSLIQAIDVHRNKDDP